MLWVWKLSVFLSSDSSFCSAEDLIPFKPNQEAAIVHSHHPEWYFWPGISHNRRKNVETELQH